MHKGFIGISIRNLYFKKKVMESYFVWANKQFEEFRVILVDDSDQHNLAAFRNISDSEAFKSARRISDELKSTYEKVLRTHDIENIKYSR